MMPLEIVLSRLARPKKCGPQYIACCPAHADKKPSLSVREGDDGRVLVHCFAGCPAADVVAALGLTMRDLFPGSGKSEGGRR